MQTNRIDALEECIAHLEAMTEHLNKRIRSFEDQLLGLRPDIRGLHKETRR